MTCVRAIADRTRRRLAPRWRAVSEDLPLLLQQTAAATTAWLIAQQLLDYPDPFFAPISALVALNMPLGERGLNAVRLLQGVVLGITIGALALLTLGDGYGALAVATFLALVIGRAVGSARIVLAQAAVAAILTVATAREEVGYQRLIEALIGTGVALIFSQALFSPEPLRLLRRQEGTALEAMAAALDLTAQALDGDEQLGERAIRSQRELRDQLSEFARTRRASTRVARHSLVWHAHTAPVVGESEDAGHLDLLGTSCLILTRGVLEAPSDRRSDLQPAIRSFATILADLADQPGERTTRQRAVDRSLELLPEMRNAITDADPDMQGALSAARVAVTDLMLFVGVDPDEARAATRPTPPDRAIQIPPPHAPTRNSPLTQLRTRLTNLFTQLRTRLANLVTHPR
jgi:hypothetical protein